MNLRRQRLRWISFFLVVGVLGSAASLEVRATTSADTWSELAPPIRWLGAGVYDPLNDRLLLVGGYSYAGAHSDVWSFSLSPPETWNHLTTAGDGPGELAGATAIYDPIGKRVVLFGGQTSAGFANDTWSLSLDRVPTWTRLITTGDLPPGRAYHAAIFDPVGRRMIVFGGQQSFADLCSNDTWALSVDGTPCWSRIEPAGASPIPRQGSGAVYDPERKAMLIAGGLGGDHATLTDTWELALDASGPSWTPIEESGPFPGLWLPLVYDGDNQRAVTVSADSRVWGLNSQEESGWTELDVAGQPPPGAGLIGVLDSHRNRLIMYAGGTWPGVWAVSLSNPLAWGELPHDRSAPASKAGHSAVYDPFGQRMLVVGGIATYPEPPLYSPLISDEIWELSLRSTPRWRLIPPRSESPRGYSQTAVIDPLRRRMISFGFCGAAGWGVEPECQSEVWSFSLASESWTRLFPSGASPEGVRFKTAIYDPPRDRMVVVNLYGPPQVHALSLTDSPKWSHVEAVGEVPGFTYPSWAFYDVACDCMIIVDWSGSVWTVSLESSRSEWRRLPSGPASIGWLGSVLLDTSRHRLVAIGNPNGETREWVYDLDRHEEWLSMPMGGPIPYARRAPIVYDPLFDRGVIFGGSIPGSDIGLDITVGDTWSLGFGSPSIEVSLSVLGNDPAVIPAYSRKTTTVAILGSESFRIDSVMVSSVTFAGAPVQIDHKGFAQRDVNHDGIVDLLLHFRADDLQLGSGDATAIMRGSTTSGSRIIGFASLRRPPRQAGQGAGFLSVRAKNPVSSGNELELEYLLADDQLARVEVFDILGRRVVSTNLENAGPRSQLGLQEARAFRPGVYLVRLTQGSRVANTRVTILR